MKTTSESRVTFHSKIAVIRRFCQHRRTNALVLGLALLVGGCSVTPPPVAKYFQRTNAVHAANFFRYALETHQWKAAYGCLTPEVQDQISLLKFSAAAQFYKHPEYEMGVGEYIYDSAFEDWQIDENTGRAIIETRYEQNDILAHDKLYLLRVGDLWYVDLSTTLAYWMQ